MISATQPYTDDLERVSFAFAVGVVKTAPPNHSRNRVKKPARRIRDTAAQLPRHGAGQQMPCEPSSRLHWLAGGASWSTFRCRWCRPGAKAWIHTHQLRVAPSCLHAMVVHRLRQRSGIGNYDRVRL